MEDGNALSILSVEDGDYIPETTKPDTENASAIDNVILLIDAISEKVTAADKTSVEEARKAYDDLTAAQKELVTNYEKLADAEDT